MPSSLDRLDLRAAPRANPSSLRGPRRMAYWYARLDTALGVIIAVADESGLMGLSFAAGLNPTRPEPGWVEDEDCFAALGSALRAYAKGLGPLPEWNLGNLGATPFQRRVWRELQRIPYGEVRTYGQIAESLGQPGAARAVGTACGRNPIPLFVPCHRVVAAGGGLGGFSCGLDIKRRLLALESASESAG